MNHSFEELLKRYEQSLQTNQPVYLDVNDALQIAEHYSLGELQFDKAVEVLHCAMKLHPDTMVLTVELALTYLMADDLDHAQQPIDALASVEDGEPYAMLPRGIMYMKKGNLNEAISVLNAACKRTTGFYRLSLTYHAGKFLMDAKHFKQAKKFFQLYLRQNPDKDEVTFYLGVCHTALKEYPKAIELYTKSLVNSPYAFSSWLNLGTLYTALKQYDKAVDAYSYAIAINEKDIFALSNRGNVYHKLKEYRLAIEDFLEVEKLEPKNPGAFYRLGEIYADLNEMDNSVNYFLKFLAVVPEQQVDVEKRCMNALLDLERNEECLPLAKNLLKAEPTAEAWNVLGFVQMRCNLSEDSIYSFTQSLALNPEQPVALNQIGVLYREAGDYPKALTHLQKAHRLDNTNTHWAAINLSILYYKMKRYDESGKLLLEAAVKNDNNHQDTLFYFFDYCPESKGHTEFFKKIGYNITYD